jgi:hypothetical protein
MFFFSYLLCWGFLIGNDGLIFYFSVRSPLDACPLLFIKREVRVCWPTHTTVQTNSNQVLTGHPPLSNTRLVVQSAFLLAGFPLFISTHIAYCVVWIVATKCLSFDVIPLCCVTATPIHFASDTLYRRRRGPCCWGFRCVFSHYVPHLPDESRNCLSF